MPKQTVKEKESRVRQGVRICVHVFTPSRKSGRAGKPPRKKKKMKMMKKEKRKKWRKNKKKEEEDVISVHEESHVSNRHMTSWRNALWIRVVNGPHMRSARERRKA